MVSEPAVELSGIRVLIADDHAPTRGVVRAALEAGGCEVCAEGASASDAVELAVEHEPDVALLDIHMPGNGIQAARQICERLPQTAIVMLTASGDDADLFDALRAGASGYLLKGADPLELPEVLKAVLAGEAALPPTLVARVLEEFRAPKRLVPGSNERGTSSARASARSCSCSPKVSRLSRQPRSCSSPRPRSESTCPRCSASFGQGPGERVEGAAGRVVLSAALAMHWIASPTAFASAGVNSEDPIRT